MSEPTPAQRTALANLLRSDWIPRGKLTTYGSIGAQVGISAYEAWKVIHDFSLRADLRHLPWHRIVGAKGVLKVGYPLVYRRDLASEGHKVEKRSKGEHKVVPFVDHHATAALAETKPSTPPKNIVVKEMTPEEIAAKYPPVVMRDSDDIDSVPWD